MVYQYDFKLDFYITSIIFAYKPAEVSLRNQLDENALFPFTLSEDENSKIRRF